MENFVFRYLSQDVVYNVTRRFLELLKAAIPKPSF